MLCKRIIQLSVSAVSQFQQLINTMFSQSQECYLLTLQYFIVTVSIRLSSVVIVVLSIDSAPCNMMYMYTQLDINFIFTDQCLQGQIRPCAKKEIKIKSICRKNSCCIAMFCILDGLVERVWFCPSSVLVEYTLLAVI